MLELDTTIMTLAEVLKTSGHVDKFTDWMCRDIKTGEVFRADHLVEGVLEARLKGDKEARGVAQSAEEAGEGDAKKKKKKVKSVAIKLGDGVADQYETILAKIDNYSGAELGGLIKELGIVSPDTGNEVTEPVEFNLMFDSSIGPTGQIKGFVHHLSFKLDHADPLTDTSVPRPRKDTLSTSTVSSTSTTVASPLPLPKSVNPSATRSPPSLACFECESSRWRRLSTLWIRI